MLILTPRTRSRTVATNPERSPDRADCGIVLCRIREARFADGVVCPRCNSTRTARYGWFSKRQRYRCNTCRRTFSDLTGSPAAYCKKLHKWVENAQCMLNSSTVRKTAKTIGVSPSTAFRWRHKNLDGLREHYNKPISGWLEFVEMRMPYSEKGQRKPTGTPQLQGRSTGHTRDSIARTVTVVTAADRRGAVESRTILSAAPTLLSLLSAFGASTGRATAILARPGSLSPYARLAKLVRAAYLQAGLRNNSPLVHLDHAIDHLRDFYTWHLRFHGVATKYLENYLAWYRMLDEIAEQNGIARLTHWPIAGRRRDSGDATGSSARSKPLGRFARGDAAAHSSHPKLRGWRPATAPGWSVRHVAAPSQRNDVQLDV